MDSIKDRIIDFRRVPSVELAANPRNWREHPPDQKRALKGVLSDIGFAGAILAREDADGVLTIIDGHLRQECLPEAELPVLVTDLTEHEADKLLAVYDPIAAMAKTNKDNLEAILRDVNSGNADVQELLADIAEKNHILPELHDGLGGEDAGGSESGCEGPVATITEKGDTWVMGRHKLLCGDCRAVETVAAFLGDLRVDAVVTDPPYGVDYASKNEFLNSADKGNHNQSPIENDAIADYRQFFADFLKPIPFADYNTVYIFMSDSELHNLRMATIDADISFGDYLIWVKNNHVLGRKDYNAKREIIFYGWKGKHKFYGGHQTNVLEFNKPQRSEDHPTMKPVKLISEIITHGSTPESLVYDPFLGSGTTLIAAEQLNRTCYGIEIEPRYCDVVVNRWETLTGKKAERIQP